MRPPAKYRDRWNLAQYSQPRQSSLVYSSLSSLVQSRLKLPRYFRGGQIDTLKRWRHLVTVNRNYRNSIFLIYHQQVAPPVDGIDSPADPIFGQAEPSLLQLAQIVQSILVWSGLVQLGYLAQIVYLASLVSLVLTYSNILSLGSAIPSKVGAFDNRKQEFSKSDISYSSLANGATFWRHRRARRPNIGISGTWRSIASLASLVWSSLVQLVQSSLGYAKLTQYSLGGHSDTVKR